LINGAAGRVGTYAVQIAAALGAEVTGVCSTGNVELVRSISAAHVVDYPTEAFTDGRALYDLISTTPATGRCAGQRPRRRPSCSTAAAHPVAWSGRWAPLFGRS
jgi:hypothetical protein